MKNKNILLLYFFCIFLSSCNKDKIMLLQDSLNKSQEINHQLAQDNQLLRNEIEKLKQNDQYYYQCGADEFTSKNYENAITILNNLKVKFPQSSLITDANKIIVKSESAISAIYQEEKDNLSTILIKAKKSELEDAISLLTTYIAEDHPNDLKKEAENTLTKYTTDYEKVRKERELEHLLGVRLVDFSSGWGLIDNNGAILFNPQLRLVFKNIANYPLNDIRIKVDFITTSGNEIFGDASYTLISEFSGITLDTGYSKTAYIYCSVGYRNEVAISSVPELFANIYVNSKFYKKVAIKKGYRTT